MIRIPILALLLVGCAEAPPSAPAPPELHVVEVRRECPPLPELRAGASGVERRIHTQTIVRLYAACAGGAHDR